MSFFYKAKRWGRKRAVRLLTGTAVGGLLVDILVRVGLPEGTAEEVGDGLRALVAWALALGG